MNLMNIIDCCRDAVPPSAEGQTTLLVMRRIAASVLKAGPAPEPLEFGELSLRRAIDSFHSLDNLPCIGMDAELDEQCMACIRVAESLLPPKAAGGIA